VRRATLAALVALIASCIIDPSEMPIGVAAFWSFAVPCGASRACTERVIGTTPPPDPVSDGYYPPAPDMAGHDGAASVQVTVEVTAP
jgi:hypothetical protein